MPQLLVALCFMTYFYMTGEKKALVLDYMHLLKTAYENASKFFELNKVEKDMIIKHMWPVTIALPKYPQTLILTFVDKYCAIKESFEDIFSEFSIKKVFRYSYIFLALIIFKRK